MGIVELGASGELVGGVAVVASLLYVGLQVRQGTAATRAASHNEITDSFRDLGDRSTPTISQPLGIFQEKLHPKTRRATELSVHRGTTPVLLFERVRRLKTGTGT